MAINLLLGSLCAVFINGAVANYQPALHPITDSPPAWPREPELVRRDVNTDCASSVLIFLSPPDPTDSALSFWAQSANGDLIETPCTMTVPATLSDEFLEYMSTLYTWGTTVASRASAIETDCGVEDFGLTVSILCTKSRTVVFTGASATGVTPTPAATPAASTTVLERVSYPTQTLWIGQSGASRQRGMAGMAICAAVVVCAIVFAM